MTGSTSLTALTCRQASAIARQFVKDPANAFIGLGNVGSMENRRLAYGGRMECLGTQPISRCFDFVDAWRTRAVG